MDIAISLAVAIIVTPFIGILIGLLCTDLFSTQKTKDDDDDDIDDSPQVGFFDETRRKTNLYDSLTDDDLTC